MSLSSLRSSGPTNGFPFKGYTSQTDARKLTAPRKKGWTTIRNFCYGTPFRKEKGIVKEKGILDSHSNPLPQTTVVWHFTQTSISMQLFDDKAQIALHYPEVCTQHWPFHLLHRQQLSFWSSAAGWHPAASYSSCCHSLGQTWPPCH